MKNNNILLEQNKDIIKKITLNCDTNNPILIIKKYNKSHSSDDLLYERIILPFDKISSSYNYNKKFSTSLSDIFDIELVNNNKLVTNKKNFGIKNRSLSSDSLLNLFVSNNSIDRYIYNKFMVYNNIINK